MEWILRVTELHWALVFFHLLHIREEGVLLYSRCIVWFSLTFGACVDGVLVDLTFSVEDLA